MTSLAPKTVQIPFETYQRLLNHLSVHASTDTWAHELLSELENEAKPVSTLPNGSYVPDGDADRTTHPLN
jgi:sulfur carrier protein ThiS